MSKILGVISQLSSGGAERSFSNLMNHFAEQDQEVSIITFFPLEIPFYRLNPKIQVFSLSFISGDFIFPFNRLRNIFNRILSLREKILEISPNVIFSFIDINNLTCILASFRLKIPLIISERTHPKYHHLPLLYKILRQVLYPYAYISVLQTESIAQFFSNLENKKIIPNLVLNPVFKKKWTNNRKLNSLISIGRLCPFKGFDDLIWSFSKISNQYPELNLIIYGEGSDRKRLERQIFDLNLIGRVFLPGAIQDISEKMVEADLFIFPSQYEGFPNALAEAMAAGLPVIASACSGNVDLVQDGINGRLFPVKDRLRLSELLLELIEDRGQAKRLSRNARKIVELYGPERVFGLWDALLEEAVAQHCQ